MKNFKISLFVISFLAICTTQSGCSLLQLPFQVAGTAVGLAGQAAQIGMAAAPYAAPFFL